MPRTLLLLVVISFAGCKAPSHATPSDGVLTAAAAIRAGVLAGSADEVARHLADDVTISHRGITQSRDEYLDSIRSGDMQYTSIDESDLRVRIYGNVAIVTGKRMLKLTWGGREFSPRLQFTAVYLHRQGKWLLAAYHSDELRPSTTAPTKP